MAADLRKRMKLAFVVGRSYPFYVDVAAAQHLSLDDEVLDRLGLRDETPRRCARRLLQVLGAQCVVAVAGIQLMRPRYQAMRAAI